MQHIITISLLETKKKLDTLKSLQGRSVDELEKQLNESKAILATMKDDVAGDILQNIMTVVLGADDNGDMILSDEEIDEVVKNIESLHGIDLNDEELKKVIIGKGRDIPGLMDMVKTVLESESVEAAMAKFRAGI
jgi:glycerol-3-phosphate dehydrogenase